MPLNHHAEVVMSEGKHNYYCSLGKEISKDYESSIQAIQPSLLKTITVISCGPLWGVGTK